MSTTVYSIPEDGELKIKLNGWYTVEDLKNAIEKLESIKKVYIG